MIMHTKTVKDLMTPLSEYKTISVEASMNEAAIALDEAQRRYEKNPREHRMLLIADADGRIVGKLSQLEIMRALEPRRKSIEHVESLSRFGVSAKYLKPMLDLCGFWEKPLIDICKESVRLKLKRLVENISKGEQINVHATLPQAIHQMAMEHHQSLLVIENNEIVGILRQTHLYKEVVETLSVCELY